jgi:hypothetical protein
MGKFGVEFNQEKNEMYEIVDVFPLAFYRGKISCHDELKKIYFDDIKYQDQYYDKKIPIVSLQTEKKYDIFFDSLKENFNQYMSVLGIDYTKLSYHVVKSWCNYIPPESDDIFDVNENRYDFPFPEPMHPHWHNHSELSFVYYLSADETSDKFCLENCFANQNDPDAVLELARANNIMVEWNKYNTKHHFHQPEEGEVIIFPSRLYHFTRRTVKRERERISIGGDVRLTSNLDGTLQLQVSPHPSLWREL